MIKTEYKDPEVHRHSAAHILISLKGPVRFQVDGQEMTGFGAVIPSGLPHTVCGAPDEEGKPLSMPKPFLHMVGKAYLNSFRKKAARHVERQKAGALHPNDWLIDYRNIDDNSFEIDIRRCGFVTVAEQYGVPCTHRRE